MIVLLHEQQIRDEQHQADAQQISPVPQGRVRNQDHTGTNDQLQHHVQRRDHRVLHPQLIRHDLVGMLPVRLAQIFMQQDPVDNREHRVDPIDRQKHDVRDVFRLENQQPEQEDDDECRPDTAHIPRKALRLPFRAEIEVAEHQVRQDGHDDQALRRKPHPGIHPGQRQQNRQGIAAIHPVDTIHEIVGIRDAHAEHQAQNHDPPALPVQDPPAREHQEHRHKLHYQPHAIRQRVDVIHETDARRQRDPHDKRPVFKPEKRRI